MPRKPVLAMIVAGMLQPGIIVRGQEQPESGVAQPAMIENPFYQPAGTSAVQAAESPARPSPPRAADAAAPAAVDRPQPGGRHTIDNPFVSDSPSKQWQVPHVANPFAGPRANRSRVLPLRWGPANRWQTYAPSAEALVESDTPPQQSQPTPGTFRPPSVTRQLRPRSEHHASDHHASDPAEIDSDEFEPSAAPGLKFPEAVAANTGEPSLPDPSSWSGANVVQPTWLDVVEDESGLSDDGEENLNLPVAATESPESAEPVLVVEDSEDRERPQWVESNSDTYDPFEDTENNAYRRPEAAAEEWQTASRQAEHVVAGSEMPPNPKVLSGPQLGRPAPADAAAGPPDDLPRVEPTVLPPAGDNEPTSPIALNLEPLSEDIKTLLQQARQGASAAETRDSLAEVIHLSRQVLVSEASVDELQAARELAAWAHNRRGELHEEAGDLPAALDDFQAAVRLDDDCWLALHNRAICRAERHEYDLALQDFAEAIDRNPGLTAAYRNRGELLASLGRSQEATEDYTMAIAQQPENAELYTLRGAVWQRMQEFDRALNDYTRSTRLNPDNPSAFTGRGNLLAEVGEYEQAIKNFELALKCDATDVAAHRSLAWLLATCPSEEIRDPQRAFSAAQEAARFAQPNDPLVLEALAAACARAGYFEHAVKFQERALATAPAESAAKLEYRLQLYSQQTPFLSGRPAGVEAATFVE